ncbi:unnamed protein product [Coccothraustes coccothraustes]
MTQGSVVLGGSGRHCTERAPHARRSALLRGPRVRQNQPRVAGRGARQRRPALIALGKPASALLSHHQHRQCQQPPAVAAAGRTPDCAPPCWPCRSVESHSTRQAAAEGGRRATKSRSAQRRAAHRAPRGLLSSHYLDRAGPPHLPRGLTHSTCAPRLVAWVWSGLAESRAETGRGPARRTAGAGGSLRG